MGEVLSFIVVCVVLIGSGLLIIWGVGMGCAAEKRAIEKKLGRKLAPGEYGAMIDWWI